VHEQTKRHCQRRNGRQLKELAQNIVDEFPDTLSISGRAMLGADAGAILMECVAESSGDYIEIGSAVGGSAVMAAVAMEKVNRPGLVFCIDRFGGNSELDGPDPLLQAFWVNMGIYNVYPRIIAFKQTHPPFPMSIHYHEFSVGLIDGDHMSEAPLLDFKALNKRVTKYLLFDNVEYEYVQMAVNKATQDNGVWEEYKSIKYESTWEEGKMVKFVALRRIS